MKEKEVQRLDPATAPIDELLVRASVREFAARRNLSGLSPAQRVDAVNAVMGCIAGLGWRIHRDQPVCFHCRDIVDETSEEYRAWAATRGQQEAGAMHEDNMRAKSAIEAAEAAKGK